MNRINNIEHTALIRQLIKGQEGALKQLFDLYSDNIYSIAFCVLKDSLESEDVVQEVFIKLWDARSRLEETGNIWSFLYVITKRLSLNRLRDSQVRVKNRVLLLEADFADYRACDSDVFFQEILTLEYEVLQKLPNQQKKVYLLSRVEGLTHKEIANQMNIAPHTVKKHIAQALKTFKKHFKNFGYLLF